LTMLDSTQRMSIVVINIKPKMTEPTAIKATLTGRCFALINMSRPNAHPNPTARRIKPGTPKSNRGCSIAACLIVLRMTEDPCLTEF